TVVAAVMLVKVRLLRREADPRSTLLICPERHLRFAASSDGKPIHGQHCGIPGTAAGAVTSGSLRGIDQQGAETAGNSLLKESIHGDLPFYKSL
ncbi:MAG: hypothetical protein ACJ8BW_05650, partial [Ktedonobacteraceae bacterium]